MCAVGLNADGLFVIPDQSTWLAFNCKADNEDVQVAVGIVSIAVTVQSIEDAELL